MCPTRRGYFSSSNPGSPARVKAFHFLVRCFVFAVGSQAELPLFVQPCCLQVKRSTSWGMWGRIHMGQLLNPRKSKWQPLLYTSSHSPGVEEVSPVLCKVWKSKPCFSTVTSCPVLRPNPQKCPSSHCLCVLQPHFLQLSAEVFLPVSSCISLFSPILMLRGWQGEQGAVPARGGQPALPRGRHSRVGWIWCVSTATQRCFCQQQHSLMLKENCSSPKKTPGIVMSQSVWWRKGWEGCLLSLCSSSISLSSIAFTRKLWK